MKQPIRDVPEREAESAIADYLRRHPDFFDRHLFLLKSLRVPHPAGTAVSLIERQIEVLRQENRELNRRLGEMVAVARENDQVSSRMQRLTLALMDAAGPKEALAALRQSLHEDFAADFVEVRLIGSANAAATPLPGIVPRDDPGLQCFEHFLAGEQPLCGRLRADQLEYLFGSNGVEVASAALIPFRNAAWRGIVAVGSRDRSRFQANMGTLFLSYLGELIGRAMRPNGSGSPT